jgi:hypothetical protein
MIHELLKHDTPEAVFRGLGIYSVTFNGRQSFPILVLDGAMGELHKYIGGGSSLNESLEIAVDYIEFVAKHGTNRREYSSGLEWKTKTTV